MNSFTWNILRKFLKLLVPFEDGEETGDGGEQRLPGTGDGSAGGEGKPEWLPEKFYDPDIGPRVETLAKSFTELEGKYSQKREAIISEVEAERKAAAPEKYEITLSDELKERIPEGVEMTLNPDDPVAEWFMEHAAAIGMSQEDFDSAVNTYLSKEIARLPDTAAEIAKLGDYGQDRLVKLDTTLRGRLEDEEYAAIQPMLTTAKGIEAMEKLLKRAGPGDFEGDGGGEALTLDELRKMQNDPRYYRDQDPAFIKKVQDGYKRLYRQ